MEKIDKIIKGTKYEKIIFELNTSWYGISATRRLPWLLVYSIKNSVQGFAKSKPPIPLVACQQFIERIAKESEPFNLHMSATQRNVLSKKFHETCLLLRDTDKDYWDKIDMNKMWEDLISQHEFAISLWMSEVNAYASVYFAYEVSFIEIIKAYTGLDSLRVGRQFEQIISEHLSSEVIEYCWKKPAIEKPRLIRHAITHNGRRLTRRLNGYKDEIITEDDQIFIFPEETTALYNTLKDSIEFLCKSII